MMVVVEPETTSSETIGGGVCAIFEVHDTQPTVGDVGVESVVESVDTTSG